MSSTSEPDQPDPSIIEINSKANNTPDENVDKDDNDMVNAATAEEFLDKRGVPMLPYQKQMFLDMIYSDGLLVCAKGISYDKVIVNILKAHSDAGNLILVINSADYEERCYKSQLDASFVHESSNNAKERESNYLLGGIQFLTTRILVVDLLKNRIPIELVTGVIVLRAHQVIESCQEAFALRLYRQRNKTGFIQAFSSSAEAFTYGYGHVEKVMRNLFVKELFIWPRFHVSIQKSLKPFEPQVIELHIPMTSKMIMIQTHILDIMNYLIKEIKRINRFIDLQEVTVENCVTKNFHKIIQAQLDCIWHQLNSQTKLLVADLRVLRSLMIATIYSDSVSLFVLMKQYRTQTYAMNNSGWVLLDAAEQIFKITKERVFNTAEEFEPEECPKWKALSEILRVEIPSDIKRSVEHRPNILNEPIKILILCQDNRTCYQLNQYLTQGFERYLFFTAMKNDLPLPKISERFKTIQQSDGSAINIVDFVGTKTVAVTPPTPVEKPIVKAMLKKSKEDSSAASTSRGGFLRDRIAKRKAMEEEELGKEEIEEGSEKSKNELSMITKDDYLDNDLFRESYVLTMTQTKDQSMDENESFDASLMETALFETFAEMENLDVTQIVNATTKPIVCIQTFKSGEDGILSLDRTLNEMKPGFVIMYHCNVTAIRQIEVYEAEQKRLARNRLKVFFLIHAQTVEEQSYLTNLRREKQAFELLIDTKSKMVVPEYQDGKTDDIMLVLQKNSIINENSRHAGGQNNEGTSASVTPSRIIVDMREFRSDLPCLIHKRGIQVVPVTITIGDYILTPDICVERKSVSDLIGSLNSGRLYNQCVQMTRHYSKPILLIEFDQNKPFHLQAHYMISGDASSNKDITQKLQLLTIYFPKLRLVWSPSPYATAQLFEEIKQNREEPNADVAAAVGSTESTKELDKIVDKINPNVHDFLLKLPGITSRNINKVMREVKDLKDLLKYSQDQLAELLSNGNDAKMLWEILHVAHKPIAPDKDEKSSGWKFKRGGFVRK